MGFEWKEKMKCLDCDLSSQRQRSFLLKTLSHLRVAFGCHAPQMHRAQVAVTLLLEVSPINDVNCSEAPGPALWTIERSKYTCIFRI